MAAAAIIPALIPLVTPLIKSAISGVEKLFGPKTGEKKAQVVFDSIKSIVDGLGASGKVPGLPSDSELKAVIESIFSQMKSSGELESSGNFQMEFPRGSTVTVVLPK